MNDIYCKDAFELLRELPENSVDLIVTDPPYWHKKSPGKPYGERKVPENSKSKSVFSNSNLYKTGSGIMLLSDFTDKEINAVMPLFERVMKRLNAYIFCSETQVPYYMMWAENNKHLSSILVWEKPLSIINKNRFSQNLEYIVRVYDYGTALNRLENNELYNRCAHTKPITGKRKCHPTEKPVDVFEKFILLSSNEGDVVLDPFCGSGVCGEACMNTNRNYILNDSNEEYYRFTKERLGQTKCRFE